MNRNYISAVLGNEHSDEPVLIFTHRHWASFLSQIVTATVLTLLPLLFLVIYYDSATLTTVSIQMIVVVGMSVYFLIITMYIFIEWITYYSNILIVTKKTLIDVNQKTLFIRQISHLHLRQIEDISSEIKGFLPTIFNYGSVIIQTAGAKEYSMIVNLPNPQKIASQILELHKNIMDVGTDEEMD